MEAFEIFQYLLFTNINSAFVAVGLRVYQIEYIKIDIVPIMYVFDYKIIK